MSHELEQLGPDTQYFHHLKEGRFMVQRSQGTGEFVFYPRIMNPNTGERDLEFIEVSGRGTVYATTAFRRPEKYGGDYNLVLIDLEEGVRMLSRVVDTEPGNVKIGQAVQAVIQTVDFGIHKDSDQPVVVFKLVEES